MDILHQQSLINNLIQKQKVVLFSVGGRGRGDWRWVSVRVCVCVFENMAKPVIISLCHDSNNIIVVRVCEMLLSWEQMSLSPRGEGCIAGLGLACITLSSHSRLFNILPHAVHRNYFENKFSTDKNCASWVR